MTVVAVKIVGAGTYVGVVRSKVPFATVEEGVLVVRSQLGPAASLNEHLVWLWGVLQHERRVLKNAIAGGARIVCECVVPKGSIRILPNGAEMLHLLGCELVVEVR
jgi:hypothetical protein